MLSSIDKLLATGPRVINIGLESFAKTCEESGAPVVTLEWVPPGRGDARLARLMADLTDDVEGIGAKVRAANQSALERLVGARPVWIDVARAGDVLPDMDRHTILHAGPPIDWGEMCGPMKGAVIGALLYEGLAQSERDAWKLAASGKVRFSPCNDHSAVGPMAGIISASMPVMVVRNETAGNLAYATMNEGWGRALRFGAYDRSVIKKLKWMERVLAPALRSVVREMGGVDVRAIIARAIQMGDECHNRDIAATSLLFKELAPVLAAVCRSRRTLREVLSFLAHQEHFSLNLSMAACKASLQAAEGIAGSTMVTAIARNGRDVGIRVSGLSARWFTAPADIPRGLYFPGYSESDANPDMGDSAICETAGLGAFVMGAAPAIVQFVGGRPEDAVQITLDMYQITLGENPNYTLPYLGFRGAPVGIDIRKVVETGLKPVVDTGIAHKEPGHGLIGAGIASVPLDCFEDALQTMGQTLSGF